MNVILPQHNIANDIPAGHQSPVKRLLRKKVVNFVQLEPFLSGGSNLFLKFQEFFFLQNNLFFTNFILNFVSNIK